MNVTYYDTIEAQFVGDGFLEKRNVTSRRKKNN